MRNLDFALSKLAARQLGLVLRRQLLDLGFTPRQIQSRRAAGLVASAGPGLYRLRSAPITWEQSLLGACLVAGPDAVVSHRAAAKVWGFRGVERAPLEILVGRDRRPAFDGVIVHRALELHRFDVTRRGPLPITTPARTLFDLAGVVDAPTLESATEGVLLSGLASWERLAAVGKRVAGRGRSGTGTLLDLLERRGPVPPTESRLEDEALRLLHRSGLPDPERQIPIRVPGRKTPVFLDVGWTDFRLALEIDSRLWHGGRNDVQRNATKANVIAAAGWTVLHFTAHDIRRRPRYVIEAIRRQLRRASSRSFLVS